MRDLIFVSLEDWDEVWRRNQFLCSGFARRFPDRKILFIAPARDVSNRLRRGRLSELRGKATWKVPGFANITVTQPLKLVPNSLSVGRRLNEAMARAHVRHAAQDTGIVNPILWLNPQDALHLVGRMEERAVIYDITDDWTELTQSKALTRRIIAQDAELCRKANAVIVCSQRLYNLKRNLARNLYLIPNGVEAEHYCRVLDSTEPLIADTARWRKPVLGYTGTIHPDRVDAALVEALARRFAEGTVALIGPMLLSAESQARLQACGNVVLTGAVAYERLPDYMRAFDVCITPHRMTPFTESLNPIKLWEYLAAGKPIVSTDVAGFRDYPEFVRIAADTEGFVCAVQEALRENPAKGAARREEARRHSWEKRIDDVEAVVNSCLLDEEK